MIETNLLLIPFVVCGLIILLYIVSKDDKNNDDL